MPFNMMSLYRKEMTGYDPTANIWDIPRAKPKSDWGTDLKIAGKVITQVGQTYPTGEKSAIRAWGSFQTAGALRAQAEELPKKTEWEIERRRKYRKRLIGEHAFTFGYAGVEISGTALDVLEETKRELELNEEQIYREGQIAESLLLEEAAYVGWAAAAQTEAGKKAEKAGKRAETLGWAGVGLGAAGLLLGDGGGGLFSGITKGISKIFCDKTRKKDIENLTYDIDTLMSLRAVSFKWKETGLPDLGVIAQELKEIIPELVQGEEPNMKVNYAGIIAVLIKSVQQQQKQIEILTEQLCPA